MRPLIALCLSLLALPGLLWLACRSAAPSAPQFDAAAQERAGSFSADRAWKHLEALAAIGPRASGTPGAAAARSYIENELTALGLEVTQSSAKVSFADDDDLPALELVNLDATIPGGSPDLLVLAAPYDSAYREDFEYVGVNDGASGTALLLEIARVLVADPLAYTVRLYFLDGEAPLGRGSATDTEIHLLGSTAAAYAFGSSGQLASIRILLLVNRVSDADLRIARDRFSHRIYRDAIWRVAAELGHSDVFPPAAEFEAPVAGHRSFIGSGMRRTVAIVDPHFGGDELLDPADHSEEDTLDRSSPRSLAIVGQVMLGSLESISARLAKIDRFSEAPVIAEPEPRADDAGTTPAGEPVPRADETDTAPPGDSDEAESETSAP